MGKFATAFRGVWGQVVKVDFNPPVGPILSKAVGSVPERPEAQTIPKSTY